MRILAAAAMVLLGLCLALFLWWNQHRAVAITVATVQKGTIELGYDEDGVVRSNVEAVVGLKAAGRLRRLAVTDGAHVREHEVIAELDTAELRAAADAADAEVERARAALREAAAGTEASVESAAADLQEAEASWRGAAARRDELENGARPEDVDRVRAARETTEAALWEARRNAQRQQTLFKRGYVPMREVDAAQSALRQAESRFREADASFRLTRNGTRPEQKRAARAQVSQSLAALSSAQGRLKKAQAARAQVDAARATLAAAVARSAQAQAQLHDAVLRAPQGGVVSLEDVSVGDVLAAGTTVARIVDPTRVWVEISIDERDIAGVRDGMPAVLTCDAYADEVFDGTVTRLQGQAVVKRQKTTTAGREEDRIFKARVHVQDAKRHLRPGMTMYAQIITGRVRDVLTVPRDAMIPVGAGWAVWVIESRHAQQRAVTVGARDLHRVEIKSGLREGETVALSGRENLHAGVPVRTP